jgi:hypothetical protein
MLAHSFQEQIRVYDQAIDDFTQAIKFNPDFPLAIFSLFLGCFLMDTISVIY